MFARGNITPTAVKGKAEFYKKANPDVSEILRQ